MNNKIFLRLSDILLAIFFCCFVYINVVFFLVTHKWSLVIFILSQLIPVTLFLLRDLPQTMSLSLYDWTVSILGTFIVFLYVPSAKADIPFWLFIIMCSYALQIIAFLSLNTSFGIVPANRGVKQNGFYSFVRHPIYLSYLILYIAYFFNNFTIFNTAVLIVAIILMVLRIQAEEKHLKNDPVYREYAKKVPWKLIPAIF